MNKMWSTKVSVGAVDGLMKLEQSKFYWLGMLLVTTVAMGIALYYQYGLHDEPCVLCIHNRLGVFGLILLSALMLALSQIRIMRALGHLTSVVLTGFVCHISRNLYLVEIGERQGECLFSAGLPPWFDLEAWMPALFEVRATCGVSPDMLFGVSMAEALYFGSVAALLVVVIFSVLHFLAWRR